MEEDVGSFKAKTHFSELLVAVSGGKKFTITRHGQKVAMLVPFAEKDTSAKGAIRAIKKLREGLTLGKKLSIRKMRGEGRK